MSTTQLTMGERKRTTSYFQFGSVPPGCKEYLPNYLLSVQMHEDKVELYTLVQMHMREVAGLGFAQGLFQEI